MPVAPGRGRAAHTAIPADQSTASQTSPVALVPASNSRQLATLIPNSRLQLYPHAGHAFLFQDEATFLPRVEGFLG